MSAFEITVKLENLTGQTLTLAAAANLYGQWRDKPLKFWKSGTPMVVSCSADGADGAHIQLTYRLADGTQFYLEACVEDLDTNWTRQEISGKSVAEFTINGAIDARGERPNAYFYLSRRAPST